MTLMVLNETLIIVAVSKCLSYNSVVTCVQMYPTPNSPFPADLERPNALQLPGYRALGSCSVVASLDAPRDLASTENAGATE